MALFKEPSFGTFKFVETLVRVVWASIDHRPCLEPRCEDGWRAMSICDCVEMFALFPVSRHLGPFCGVFGQSSCKESFIQNICRPQSTSAQDQERRLRRVLWRLCARLTVLSMLRDETSTPSHETHAMCCIIYYGERWGLLVGGKDIYNSGNQYEDGIYGRRGGFYVTLGTNITEEQAVAHNSQAQKHQHREYIVCFASASKIHFLCTPSKSNLALCESDEGNMAFSRAFEQKLNRVWEDPANIHGFRSCPSIHTR